MPHNNGTYYVRRNVDTQTECHAIKVPEQESKLVVHSSIINISVHNHPRRTLTSICRTWQAPTYSSLDGYPASLGFTIYALSPCFSFVITNYQWQGPRCGMVCEYTVCWPVPTSGYLPWYCPLLLPCYLPSSLNSSSARFIPPAVHTSSRPFLARSLHQPSLSFLPLSPSLPQDTFLDISLSCSLPSSLNSSSARFIPPAVHTSSRTFLARSLHQPSLPPFLTPSLPSSLPPFPPSLPPLPPSALTHSATAPPIQLNVGLHRVCVALASCAE